MVHIDVSLGLSALILFPLECVVAGFVIGGTAGVLANIRDTSMLSEKLNHVARKIILLFLMSSLASAVAVLSANSLNSMPVQALLVGFGLVYAAADLVTAALIQSLRDRANFGDELMRLTRPIAVVYLGHVSTGVVIVLLFDAMGYVGLVVMVTLVLMMQNSFNLLLRIRTAYQETIQALVLAAEIQVPGEKGHAHRVAEIATATGRRLGLRSKELETLGYAALLHDIGKIGADVDKAYTSLDHAQVGADIVEQIPFVRSAADIVRAHEDSAESVATGGNLELTTAVLLLKASSRLDRLALLGLESTPRELVASEAFDDIRSSSVGSRVMSGLEATASKWATGYPSERVDSAP
ncbi:MAG: HD domain-containing protein [Coriobacteriia bacterium]|nr:HD domain-containing protein [Coriobacteriia bacterium]